MVYRRLMENHRLDTEKRQNDNIQSTISELLKSLSETTSEDQLLDFFDPKIREIKALFDKNPCSDNPFLFQQYLKIIQIHDCIGAFAELVEYIPYIETMADYTSVKKELLEIRHTLQGNPVAARIDKELREVEGLLPNITAMQKLKEDQAFNSKINQLESDSPLCNEGHPMVIRNGGEHGYFWGCSHFPDCFSRRPLKKSELDYLLTDSAPLPPKREKLEKQIFEDRHKDVQENTSDVQESLFNLLRNLRTDFAKNEKLPPYCIFSDRTLKEMSCIKPDSINDLLTVHGVGLKKLEKYGQPFFDIIINFHFEHSDDTEQEAAAESGEAEVVPVETTVLTQQEKNNHLEHRDPDTSEASVSENNTIEETVVDLIMGFRLDEKTPLEAMTFIHDLQKRIQSETKWGALP